VRLYTRSIPVIELVNKIKRLRSFGVRKILMGCLRDVGQHWRRRIQAQGGCHYILIKSKQVERAVNGELTRKPTGSFSSAARIITVLLN